MAKCKNCNNLYNLSDVNDVIVGKWCQKINDSPDVDMERECEHFKRMTQADRIRSMSDEELAAFIVGLNNHCLAGIGLCDCSKEEETTCEQICMRKTREWLQSEVEVGK